MNDDTGDLSTFEEFIGWVASCISIVIYFQKLSPFIMVLKGNLNYEESPAFYILMCHINCLIWIMYGDQVFSQSLKVFGIVSCGICVACLSIYTLLEVKQYILSSVLNIILFYMASSTFYNYLSYTIDDEDVIGKIAIGSSLSIYVFNLNSLYNVISQKNLIFLRVNDALQFLAASIFWTIYGIILKDIYIKTCFILGGVIAFLEVFTYYIFKNQYSSFIPSNEKYNEVESSDNEHKSLNKDDLNESKIDDDEEKDTK